jgi:hypothetical protein
MPRGQVRWLEGVLAVDVDVGVWVGVQAGDVGVADVVAGVAQRGQDSIDIDSVPGVTDLEWWG